MSSKDHSLTRAAATAALLLGIVCAPAAGHALDVVAVYRTACKRQIGVIVRVEKRKVHLLQRDGRIRAIPRHEIVSLVHYPVSRFHIAPPRGPLEVQPIRIETRQERQWVELAHGWPINYSEHNLSLLLPSGKDFAVDRDSIWRLRFTPLPAPPPASPPPRRQTRPAQRKPTHRPTRPSASLSASRPSLPTSQPTSRPASQPATLPASQPASLPASLPRKPLRRASPRRSADSQLATQQFEHPQTSGFCARPSVPAAGRRIFPQQILNDRVVIRRELDRLMKGYEELLEDMGDQKFYPVPQIYHNRTSLGFWGSAFSRYAASESRSNNLTPLLMNTYSSGPFRYQHIIYTGNTPNRLLIHNESQTQLFYRFKAAYFHASLLIDPNLALVGEKFFWREEDLADETLDDRISEYAVVELGFDLGPVALQLQPVSMGQVAVKLGDIFDKHQGVALMRGGLLVTLPELSIEAMGGYSGQYETETSNSRGDFGRGRWAYAYVRLNLEWRTPWHQITARLWTAFRHMTYELDLSTESHAYSAVSVSNALQVTVPFLHRFEAGGHLIIETQSQTYQNGEPKLRVHPKFSLFAAMSF